MQQALAEVPAPGVKRKLAAILSADVKGYARLMGADEEGTLRALTAHRAVIAALIARHDGRIVDTAGDGVLAAFASAVEAVCCGLEIQEELAARNTDVPAERRLEFRIGINLGDVIVEGDGLYGDGINVAARIQALAEPGGVYISGGVYDQIKGKLPFGYGYLGEQRVKNITEPVRVYRVRRDTAAVTRGGATRLRWGRVPMAATMALAGIVVAGGAGVWYGAPWPTILPPAGTVQPAPAAFIEAMALPLPDKPSIAVLPFENFSGDPKQERLADGITEDIITDLSRFRELFVIARNSTFVYEDRPVDVRQIARDLGVRYVLEGSLQTDGGRVRITAQMVDGTTGNHVWAERYDRPLDDIFTVQDEVTQKIAASIGGYTGALARASKEAARRKPPGSLQAYDYYLLGVEHKHRFTEKDNNKAQELLKHAIELDPNLARAYVGLAWTYNIEIDSGWTTSEQRSMEEWLNASRTAIALDPSDGEARLALGVYYAYNSDLERAAAEVEEALSLNPNSADVLVQSAYILPWAGKPEQAVEAVERAVRLNPHYPNWYNEALLDAYFHAGAFEKALDAENRKDEASIWDYFYRPLIYAQLGRHAEAAEAKAELLQRDPDYSAERWLSEKGAYTRETELNLFLESNRKARLPICATEEQLAKYPDMERLDRCDKMRARAESIRQEPSIRPG